MSSPLTTDLNRSRALSSIITRSDIGDQQDELNQTSLQQRLLNGEENISKYQCKFVYFSKNNIAPSTNNNSVQINSTVRVRFNLKLFQMNSLQDLTLCGEMDNWAQDNLRFMEELLKKNEDLNARIRVLEVMNKYRNIN